MQRFQNKHIAITGGNSGIGLATARRLVQEGAKVTLMGRNEQSLKAAQAELGDAASIFAGDVSKVADLEGFVEHAFQAHGELDGLYLNAGIAEAQPTAEMDEAHYDRVMNINVKGVAFGVQKALPRLKEGASVLITGSVAADIGMAGMAIYSATKGAVRTLARAFSAELAPQGIRVNSIAPGPIETPLFDRMGMSEPEMEGLSESILSRVPAGRFGNVDEIAATAAFLLSDEATYIRGAEVQVDGGMAQV